MDPFERKLRKDQDCLARRVNNRNRDIVMSRKETNVTVVEIALNYLEIAQMLCVFINR